MKNFLIVLCIFSLTIFAATSCNKTGDIANPQTSVSDDSDSENDNESELIEGDGVEAIEVETEDRAAKTIAINSIKPFSVGDTAKGLISKYVGNPLLFVETATGTKENNYKVLGFGFGTNQDSVTLTVTLLGSTKAVTISDFNDTSFVFSFARTGIPLATSAKNLKVVIVKNGKMARKSQRVIGTIFVNTKWNTTVYNNYKSGEYPNTDWELSLQTIKKSGNIPDANGFQSSGKSISLTDTTYIPEIGDGISNLKNGIAIYGYVKSVKLQKDGTYKVGIRQRDSQTGKVATKYTIFKKAVGYTAIIDQSPVTAIYDYLY